MSDYTPTTEEVKANYALVGDDEVVNNINEQKFDRWLEQHNAEVTKTTEQRIIKLLEGHLGAYENTPDVTPDFGIEVAIGLVKAFIKGEK